MNPLQFIIILAFLTACVNNNNQQLSDRTCECISKIDTNDTQVELQFSNCLKIYFENYIEINGFDREGFKNVFPSYLDSMGKSCPKFIDLAKVWFYSDLNYLEDIAPSDFYELNESICDSLQQLDWIYNDKTQGDLEYSFTQNEVTITNHKAKSSTTFIINRKGKCSLNYTLSKTNDPFNLLLPENHTSTIHFIKFEKNKLIALLEVDNGIYKEIEFKKK